VAEWGGDEISERLNGEKHELSERLNREKHELLERLNREKNELSEAINTEREQYVTIQARLEGILDITTTRLNERRGSVTWKRTATETKRRQIDTALEIL
jgi:chromosome segregation ATPase